MSTTSSESPDRSSSTASRSQTAPSSLTPPANGTTTSTDGRSALVELSLGEDTAARLSRLALLAIGILATLNLLWQLGSSSYYVDEVAAVSTALAPLRHLIHAVGTFQVSPPAYYVFLHEWLGQLGSQREWISRLPSALAGVLLVGAVYWLSSLVSERRATRLAAAALAAVSPFVLQYAQIAEPYVFEALACTVALAAAIRAQRDTGSGRHWLAVALAASVLALCLHYTATLVIAPLCAWVAMRQSVPWRWRLAFPLACAACELALVPLVITQHHAHPGRPGTAVSAAVSWTSVKSMVAVPFVGRVQALEPLALVVMVVAGATAALAALRSRDGAPAGARSIAGALTGRRLVVALAVGEPICLFLLSVLGGSSFWGHLMLTRYAAAAAPLLIVTLALALEALPFPVALSLGGCAAVVAVAGSLESHRPSGFYLDARGAVAYVQRHALPGDAVLATSDVSAQLPLLHYGIDRLHPVWFTGANEGVFVRAVRARTWLIAEGKYGSQPTDTAMLAYERITLRPLGQRPLAVRTFPGLPGVVVSLIAPIGRRKIPPG